MKIIKYIGISIIFVFILLFCGCNNNLHESISKNTNDLEMEIENLKTQIEEYRKQLMVISDNNQELEERINKLDKQISDNNQKFEERVNKLDKQISDNNQKFEEKINKLDKQISDMAKEKAVELVKEYIQDNSIEIPYPEYGIHHYETKQHDNINYYVIRIYYTDANHDELTNTIFRYWVNLDTGKILKEDLWTGELFEESFQ